MEGDLRSSKNSEKPHLGFVPFSTTCHRRADSAGPIIRIFTHLQDVANGPRNRIPTEKPLSDDAAEKIFPRRLFDVSLVGFWDATIKSEPMQI